MTDIIQTTLVIGGTGMLRPAVHQLLKRGMRVLLVSRRPRRAVPHQEGPGELIPITAEWQKPEALVDAVLMAIDGHPVTHVIVWVHSPYRTAIISELDRAVDANTVVVNVWGSASQDPREVRAAEMGTLAGRDTRDLVLGYAREAGASRWLTHAEISDGVLHVLNGTEPVHIVGQIDPWDQRP